MKILNTFEILDELDKAMKPNETIFHPDTNNTFAAYQIMCGKWEVWMNARNGEIITMRSRINNF